MEGRSFSGRERNCFFLNLGASGSGRFATTSAVSGIDYPDDGRALVMTDWDRDGREDLWISNRNGPRLRFLHNRLRNQNHFVSLQLIGNGTTTNRDAIGARVEVEWQGETNDVSSDSSTQSAKPIPRLVRTLYAGQGFLSQSSKWMHFGLGPSPTIQQVTVRWPGGATETFSGVQPNSRYRLLQGQGVAEEVAGETANEFVAGEPSLPAETRVARIALTTRVPMPIVNFRHHASAVALQPGNTPAPTNLVFTDGKPTLVNLWASWCLPCVEEMSAMATDREKLKAAGLRVVSLNVDPLTENGASPDEVAELIAKLGVEHDWGFVDELQMTLLQQLHDQFFFMKRPLPLPSSFLVDAKGRLSVIYRGPVSVEQMVADAQLDGETYAELWPQAAIFPGRTLEHSRVVAVARRSDLQTRYHVAAWLEENGRNDDAIQHFQALVDADANWALPIRHLAKLELARGQTIAAKQLIDRALALDPDSAGALNTLGLILSRQGNEPAAMEKWRRALEIDPQFAEAHNNLGSSLAALGQVMAARESFQRAVEADSQFPEAYTNLGSTYAAQNDIKRAIQEYERALSINPSYVDAHNNLGTMYARLGDYKRAIEYYQTVLKLAPDHPDARRNLALAQKLLRP